MIPETIEHLRLPYPGRDGKLVRVYVPAHDEGETLPVVYMTDGQNLFDKESSGFGCWYTREAVRDERAATGRAAVIVGIHNADVYRINDLTPKCIGRVRGPVADTPVVHPAGEVFESFLLNTVKPAVEARFPVKTGRADTAFCGSSMGGLMAFYLALTHPDVFGAAGAFSPAFHVYDAADLERWIRGAMPEEKPYLYLFVGGADELERLIRTWERRVCQGLRAVWPEALLREAVVPGARHHETGWEPRFREFLHDFLQLGKGS